MDIVESVKAFLKQEGLNWTGHKYKNSKNQLVNIKASDFEQLQELTLLINFGEDGLCGMLAEIDDITFKINGVNNSCPFTAYSGDNEENVFALRERNLSEEWAKFQLKANGLVYAAALRVKCQQERERITQENATQRKHLEKKIEYLQKRLKHIDLDEERDLRNISMLEKLAEDI